MGQWNLTYTISVRHSQLIAWFLCSAIVFGTENILWKKKCLMLFKLIRKEIKVEKKNDKYYG